MRKVLLALLIPTAAHAFCGFYVTGSDAQLANDATQVVLMRDGARTVLTMQNNYQGPPDDFALVVPVPVVLQKENVKTLARDAFDALDSLDAPRLVEYWEEDPCKVIYDFDGDTITGEMLKPEADAVEVRHLGVKIEAQFVVGEYDIVILSANDSTGLETWLKQNHYKIPDGAEPYLRPYVQQGSKFFVAKVDAKKVKRDGDKTMLSPLRFFYDSDQFTLPIRLGLANAPSGGAAQDLIVHILGRQRYEVANYDDVTIPTNLVVSEATRAQFATFYAALFDDTVAKHPKAIVTEYAWSAGSCDPCPVSPLDGTGLAAFGGDVMPNPQGNWVLTRLHARYTKDTLGDDLVFREARAIVGGRGTPEQLDQAVRDDSTDNFQGRYLIEHPWTGAIDCPNPKRGRWGGPTENQPPAPAPVKDTAFAPRGASLASFLTSSPTTAPAVPPPVTPPPARVRGCACDVGGRAAGASGLVLLAIALASLLRRRRPHA